MTNGAIRLSDERIAASVRVLLDTYPDATVVALAESGQFCPVPDVVPLAGHRALTARAGEDLVAAGSRQMLLDMFVHARSEGACQARLTALDGRAATGFLLDVRRLWGIYLLIWVMAGRDQTPAPIELPAPDTITPRCGRMWRSRHGQILRVDATMCRMLGYSEPELLSIGPFDLLHPDDQPHALDEWLDLVNAVPGAVGRTCARRRRADGSWLWLEVTNTNHLDDPDQPHVLSEMIDVSADVEVRDQLRHHQELLRRIAEAVPLALWVFREPSRRDR